MPLGQVCKVFCCLTVSSFAWFSPRAVATMRRVPPPSVAGEIVRAAAAPSSSQAPPSTQETTVSLVELLSTCVDAAGRGCAEIRAVQAARDARGGDAGASRPKVRATVVFLFAAASNTTFFSCPQAVGRCVRRNGAPRASRRSGALGLAQARRRPTLGAHRGRHSGAARDRRRARSARWPGGYELLVAVRPPPHFVQTTPAPSVMAGCVSSLSGRCAAARVARTARRRRRGRG